MLRARTATRITDVDLDRYEIDGEVRPVMVAARSASRNDLPEPAGCRSTSSTPTATASSPCPPTAPTPTAGPDVDALADDLVADHPELYFGDGLAGWYAIVGTERVEQGGEPFAADTGIEMSSTVERACWRSPPVTSSRCSRPS